MVHHWHDAAGIALFRLGRYNEARDAVQAAVRANPSFDMLHVLMAMCHEAAGDHEAAARSVADTLAISPHLSLAVVEQMFSSFPFVSQLVTHLRAAGMPPG
jgi:tetratricopeptide (TPR) repeat protein